MHYPVVVPAMSPLTLPTPGPIHPTKDRARRPDIVRSSSSRAKIDFILSRLSEQEMETAARSSHDYLRINSESESDTDTDCDTDSDSDSDSDGSDVADLRDRCVRRIVGQFLESKHGNADRALAKFRKTLEFRRTARIDALVRAFDNDIGNDNGNDIDNDNGNDSLAETLRRNLSSKKFYVQGFDREGRSTLYFIPRNVVDHDLESAFYSIERAIASSRSVDGTINCVVDFSGFSISNRPPMEIGKEFLTTLRTVYAVQIHRIFLVHTPFSFSMMWNLFSPYLGNDKRDRIQFVPSGTGTRVHRELLDLYDLDQVPSWFLPGGTKNRSLDLDEYLYQLDRKSVV